jgi:hypothetical protein
MEFSADVLIVARNDDRVAIRMQRAFEERGRRVVSLDGPSTARLFTIRVRDNSTVVMPSVPMFVRPSAWWCERAQLSRDDIFLRDEEYATFWAAAALCSTPVINRPGRCGAVGRMTWGDIAGVLNLDIGPDSREIFASGPELIKDTDGVIWGEDPNYISAPIGNLHRTVPVRARRLNPNAQYEIVTVVGGRGFSATDDSRTLELDLVDRSIKIARQVDVHFATITWAVDQTGAAPIRLNAAPEESELRYAWHEVANALCEDLAQ